LGTAAGAFGAWGAFGAEGAADEVAGRATTSPTATPASAAIRPTRLIVRCAVMSAFPPVFRQ